MATVPEERLGQDTDGIGPSGSAGRLLDGVRRRDEVARHLRGSLRSGEFFHGSIECLEKECTDFSGQARLHHVRAILIDDPADTPRGLLACFAGEFRSLFGTTESLSQ